MTKLTTTLILTLLVYFLAIWLLILCLREDEPKQADHYDYRICQPIEVENRDSLMMMCYVRNTKGSRDTLFRLRNKL